MVLRVPKQLKSMSLKLNPNLTLLPQDCYSDPTEFQANVYDKKQLKNPTLFQKEKKTIRKSSLVVIHEIHIFHRITTKSITWYLVLDVENRSCPPTTKGPKFNRHLKLFFLLPQSPQIWTSVYWHNSDDAGKVIWNYKILPKSMLKWYWLLDGFLH